MVWEGDLQGNKQPLVLTMYGQICGNLCPMQRKRKQNKDGLSRNQSSTTPDNGGEYSSLNQTTKKFKLTMKAARRKWEVPMPAAMPCKMPIKSSGATHRNIKKRRTRNACVADADESMRPRLERAVHKPHQDHIAACTNSFRCLKRLKIPDGSTTIWFTNLFLCLKP